MLTQIFYCQALCILVDKILTFECLQRSTDYMVDTELYHNISDISIDYQTTLYPYVYSTDQLGKIMHDNWKTMLVFSDMLIRFDPKTQRGSAILAITR